VNSKNPDVEYPWLREEYLGEPVSRTDLNNAAEGRPKRTERIEALNDLYNENDAFTVTDKDRNGYLEYLSSLEDPDTGNPDWMREALDQAVAEDLNYYVLEFSNLGGLVMPIILRIGYADDSTEDLYLPAEIWRRSPTAVKKLLVRDKEITEVTVDPHWETADTDVSNNHFPRRIIPSRLEIFEDEEEPAAIGPRDLMQDMKTRLDADFDPGKTDAPDAYPAEPGSADLSVPVEAVP
jgi:hypothetical protein